MSPDTLVRAEQLLMKVVPQEGSITPAALMRAAADEAHQHGADLTAEDLRIAFWSLLGSGELVEDEDHTLRRAHHTAVPSAA